MHECYYKTGGILFLQPCEPLKITCRAMALAQPFRNGTFQPDKERRRNLKKMGESLPDNTDMCPCAEMIDSHSGTWTIQTLQLCLPGCFSPKSTYNTRKEVIQVANHSSWKEGFGLISIQMSIFL